MDLKNLFLLERSSPKETERRDSEEIDCNSSRIFRSKKSRWKE